MVGAIGWDLSLPGEKIGDAAWEDRIALFPVTVLTTVTENREQEVMLSSPVSLAPLTLEQSRCHCRGLTRIGNDVQQICELTRFLPIGFDSYEFFDV
jgi:hypothetical protein